jgi:hypothetical protein
MKRNNFVKNGVIVAIIFLLFTATITPLSIGKTNTSLQHQNTAFQSNENIKQTSSITTYIIDKNTIEEKEIFLCNTTVTMIYEKFLQVQQETNTNPLSEKAILLQEEFFNLLLNHNAFSDSMSLDDISALAYPSVNKARNHRLPHLFYQHNASEFFCNFVTLGQGAALPLIILPRFIPIILTPIPRAFVYWSTDEGFTSAGGLLSGTGFLAGGKQKGIALGFWGIGFSIFLPPIRAYGMFGYALFTRVNAQVLEYYPPNNAPKITQTYPIHNQEFVPLTTNKLYFSIEDKDKDLMSYSVTTSPDIGSASDQRVPDGMYEVEVSGLQSLTTYDWTIEVSDGKDTTIKTFSFTTVPIGPIISNPLPKDNAMFIPIWTSNVSFDLYHFQGHLMDWTVETQPYIGSASASNVGANRIVVDVSGLEFSTSYQWFVNATDGGNWTRKTFTFSTVAEGELVLEPSDDTRVNQAKPDHNYGSSTDILIRNEYGAGGSGFAWDGLIRFDLSDIPENVSVEYAMLNLYYYAWKDNNPSGRVLHLYKAVDEWDEDTVTWNTQPTYNAQASAFAFVPSSTKTWMQWDVTLDVQGFLDGSTENYGWKITDDTKWNTFNIPIMRFYSKENTEFIPYLYVGYQE